MLARHASWWPLLAVLVLLSSILLAVQGASDTSPQAWADTASAQSSFPTELVDFVPAAQNPVFTPGEPGAWDERIRERGWILREEEVYHLWYTGYDGSREGIRRLGYATSPDALRWTRFAGNPLIPDQWVEDMMVVKHGDTYYMFAEGLHDESQLLTSKDRMHWHREGKLDIRRSDNRPLTRGPCGTPTAWFDNGAWYLLYERMDLGVWLAVSRDLKTWTNVQDEPVLRPGPEQYDQRMIAVNQVIKHHGQYYAYYHGSGDEKPPRAWTTNVARSKDLLHWEKYPHNPIVAGDKSSGIVVFDGRRYRLYTMHNQVDAYYSRGR